jgi:hypothetical protein
MEDLRELLLNTLRSTIGDSLDVEMFETDMTGTFNEYYVAYFFYSKDGERYFEYRVDYDTLHSRSDSLVKSFGRKLGARVLMGFSS